MKDQLQHGLEYSVGALVRKTVPMDYLLRWPELGRWYIRNPYHYFKSGDVLVARPDRRIYEGGRLYVERPVVVIEDYEMIDSGGFGLEGCYKYILHIDAYSDHGDLVIDDITGNPVRTVDNGLWTTKWGLEYNFARVPRGMRPKETLQYYDNPQPSTPPRE